MTAMESTKWPIALRYRLIEVIVYWEGRLTTKHLINAFGISRQTASNDINDYKKLAPNNLNYDDSIKGYVPSEGFQPLYSEACIDEYLGILSSNTPSNRNLATQVLRTANTQAIKPPARNIDTFILRALIQACSDQRRIEVNYASFSNPQGEARIIAPHTLIHTGLRWSLRAYCEKNKRFIELVLSRFRGECEDMGEVLQGASIEDDTDWNTPVTIELTPDPRLTPEQQSLIADDYGMADGKLLINTHGPLVQYSLDQLNVSATQHKELPRAQQLIVRNLDQIKQWVWDQ